MARVLVVNAGSSTVKLSLIDEDERRAWTREFEAPQAQVDSAQLRAAIGEVEGQVDVVGHRIVHGGGKFRDATLIDTRVERELWDLAALAPLHQPKSLALLDSINAALPGVPAFACFDTGFHATLPPRAHTYALPAAWRDRWPIRRYGFHGLSHAWVARRAAELLDVETKTPRIVSCHLGAGASLCAIAGGRSRATTMGFTPLAGLVMASRSGDVDPGLLLWLLEREGMSPAEASQALEHESGLLGLGGTADMREVLRRRARGDASAELALDVYLERLGQGIGAMAATLGGLDALVFTGGIGERSAAVRVEAAEQLGFLGIVIDEQRNAGTGGDREIGANGAVAKTLVILAREDLEIARQVRRALEGRP